MLILLAMTTIFVLSSCDESVIDKKSETTADTQFSAATDETTADSTAPETEELPTEDEIPEAYDKIISAIIANYPWNNEDSPLSSKVQGLSYMYIRHDSLSEVGFSLLDLDGNGQNELIISGIDAPFIYDLYTIKDGEAVQLFSSGERYAHFLYKDGYVDEAWSGSAVLSGRDYFKITDGELVFIERVAYDGFHAQDIGLVNDAFEPKGTSLYFKSASQNESAYIHITEDEAKEIKDSYENKLEPLDIEFTPLSEYEN